MNEIKLASRPRFVFVVCNRGHVHVRVKGYSRGQCHCGQILWLEADPIQVKVKEKTPSK